MKPRILSLVALLFFLLLLGAPAHPVAAHANLLQSLPEANAILDRPPIQVELFFSEPIDRGFSTIEILDSAGNRVNNEDVSVDPFDSKRLTTSLLSIHDGVYTVSWRVLSSVDSHVTAGAFPFAVGEVDAAALEAAAQAGDQIKLLPGEIIARWLTYLSVMTLSGGIFFLHFVWSPAAQKGLSGMIPQLPLRRIAKLAFLILVAASAVWLLVQVGQVSGQEITVPWNPNTGSVLFATRFGALLLVRLTLSIALLWVWLRSKTTWRSWLGIIVGLLLLLTISLGSHAAAQPDPLVSILVDWLHLTAASVWVGGLILFVTGLFTIKRMNSADRTRLVAELIPRFSTLALVSVSILAITGAYSSIIQVGSLDALMNTSYGRTLMLKLILIIPMLLLGVANLLITTPNMKQAAANKSNHGLVGRFRRVVSSEVILGAAVLLTVGVLTTLPPARVATTPPKLSGQQQVDDLKISLDVSPGRRGLNTFLVEIDAGRNLLAAIREVSLQFSPASGDLPPIQTTLKELGDGKYSVQGGFLALPDIWQIQVAVRRENAFDAFANFDFNLGFPTAVETAESARPFPWQQVSGTALVLAGAIIFLVVLDLFQEKKLAVIIGMFPGLFLVTVGLLAILKSPEDETVILVNPIPPNLDSVSAGQELYQENCVPCHGTSGIGDGPVGLTLIPPPSDLRFHTVPGVHPDGQLYEWITNGYPRSPMPAFRDLLSAEERWHLVNYIRTLALQ